MLVLQALWRQHCETTGTDVCEILVVNLFGQAIPQAAGSADDEREVREGS